MKKNVKILSALSLLAMTSVAAAADAPKLSDILTASGITATGYVDGTYVWSTGDGFGHQFDAVHNSFQLNQAAFTIAFQPEEGFGALVNVIGGSDANLLPPFGSGDLVIPQAFVQYAGGGFTISAGRLLTLAGAEVIAPTGNTNVSRSLLFYAEPLTHTGVRANFALSDMFGFTVGVNNGWNYTSLSNSPAKTLELGVSFAPADVFSVTAQGYFGKDPVFDLKRQFVDVVATFKATDALSFVVSYDMGKQDIANADAQEWSGVAAYVNIAFNSMFRLSVRGEYFDDKDGFMFGGGSQKIKEATVTFGYAPSDNFEVRAEVRHDEAEQPIFVDVDNTRLDSSGDFPADDTQTTFLLEALYKF